MIWLVHVCVWCDDVTGLFAFTQVAGNLELNELPDVTPMDEFFNDGHHSDIVVIIAVISVITVTHRCTHTSRHP